MLFMDPSFAGFHPVSLLPAIPHITLMRLVSPELSRDVIGPDQCDAVRVDFDGSHVVGTVTAFQHYCLVEGFLRQRLEVCQELPCGCYPCPFGGDYDLHTVTTVCFPWGTRSQMTVWSNVPPTSSSCRGFPTVSSFQ